MSALILRGKPVAERIGSELAPSVTEFRKEFGLAPTLAVLRVGNPPAAVSYALSIDRVFGQCEMGFQMHVLPDDADESQLIDRLHELTRADDVHGILLQRPLPANIDIKKVLGAFPVLKDVEGITPNNIGALALRTGDFFPTSTPQAAIEILDHYGIALDGKRALVVGRSDIVGKPMALLLLHANATVQIAHSHSRDLGDLTRQAEVLIAAVGRPKFITGDMIAGNAVVVDLGVNVIDPGLGGRPPLLTGDVDFAVACEVAAAITPVPGGTGPVTTAILMRNTVHAAQKQGRQLGAKGRIKWLPILKSPKRRQ